MKKTKILFLSVLSMLIIVSSCKKDDPDPINEAQVLVDYVEANFSPTTIPAYITNSGLAEAILAGDPYIIDIRSLEVYNAGHIEGAENVADSKTLLAHLTGASIAMDREIVIACYTGQTAAWGTALLRLSGYSNAKSLKFGMSSWNSATNYMDNNVGDAYANFTETTSNPKGAAGELPVINTGLKTGSEILAARIAEVFADGFGACAELNTVVVPGRADWYIMNYWSAAHYDTEHVEGAIMYDPTATPHTFTTAGDLLTVPSGAAEKVAVYCYTGQGSAFMAAYFHVLGYENVKSLKFGANGMYVSTMPGTRWPVYEAQHVTDRDLTDPLKK
jgi:rhodanese-related sulfurtransferase